MEPAAAGTGRATLRISRLRVLEAAKPDSLVVFMVVPPLKGSPLTASL
jgi:hypothetical protein